MKHLRVFVAGIIFIGAAVSAGSSIAEEKLAWFDCIRESARNNPDLISAVQVIRQQKGIKFAAESGLLPQVDGTASISRAQTSVGGGSSVVGSSSSSRTSINNDYTYGVSATQLIFDGLTTYNTIRADAENVRAAQEGYSFTSAKVRYNLRTAFISLLKSQAMVRVAEEIIRIRKGNLDLITLRYESGFEHLGALKTAQANFANAEYGLAQAKRGIVIAEHQLTKEMGRRIFIPVRAEGDFTVNDKAKEKPAIEPIAKKTPSVLQAAAKTRSAAYSIKSAYGSFMPQVNGAGGSDRTNSTWPPDNTEWNIGLTVTMPFFDGGQRLAELDQAKAVYSQAEENERSVLDAAIVSLEQTWALLQDALQEVYVQKMLLIANEERSRIAKAQYETGFIQFDNWIIIENDLVTSKKNYLNAEAAALQAEAGWIQAKGETLEYAH